MTKEMLGKALLAVGPVVAEVMKKPEGKKKKLKTIILPGWAAENDKERGVVAMSGGYTGLVAKEEKKVETEDGTHTGDRASSASSSCRRSSTAREDRGANVVPSL
jgi:hypothetical protein